MNWQTAIEFARLQDDLTYEEWCNLYYDKKNPIKVQVERALRTAHSILVRNEIIDKSVVLSHAW